MLADEAVDAWRFEKAVAADCLRGLTLSKGLALWRGPAYADFADEGWAQAERSRLTELRLRAVERQAEARLALGLAAEAVPELDAHVTEHPWREEAWRLLALALYRTGRQGDALAVLRRARSMLIDQLGVDPGTALSRLETDILNQAEHWTVGRTGVGGGSRGVRPDCWCRRSCAAGVDGGVAAQPRGDRRRWTRGRTSPPTCGSHCGRGAWRSRPDREGHRCVRRTGDLDAVGRRGAGCAIVAAAERALRTQQHQATPRARLLATIALESRGSREPVLRRRRVEAEEIARGLDDPVLLAFALNGVFMQTCYRAGLAPQRDAIGEELVDLSERHGFVTYEVLGHLIRLQARSALGDFATADHHATAADALAARHELPLVGVFTQWYRAMLRTQSRRTAKQLSCWKAPACQGCRKACWRWHLPVTTCGMVCRCLTPTTGPTSPGSALSCSCRRTAEPRPPQPSQLTPDPPPGLLLEALWCLTAHAARHSNDNEPLARAQAALAPAATEQAAGSGLPTLGPVTDYL